MASRHMPPRPISDTRYLRPAWIQDVDLEGLQRALRRRVEGEVRFDRGSRAAYATDASNFRQPPLGVVVPKNAADMIAAVTTCRDFGAPITHRGGGTSLAGQSTNVAVIIDSSKYMHRILAISPRERWAWVEPGVVLDVLKQAANRYQLTFGPDPSTHDRCTLGGMIGNNACGVHSVRAGRTADNVEELDILLYDGTRMTVGPTTPPELEQIVAAGGRRGEVYRLLRELRDRHAEAIRTGMPVLPRRVSGFNIDELLPEKDFQVARSLVGTEGTCVSVLAAKVKLIDEPQARALVVLGFDSLVESARHVTEILSHQPMGLEGVDRRLVHNMHKKNYRVEDLQLMPDGHDYLLVEFGGSDQAEANDRARKLMKAMGRLASPPSMVCYDSREQEERVWQVREAGLGATARVPGQQDTWPGWEDSAVPPERVADYLDELLQLYDKYGYEAALYGHFGDGCIHTRINFDLNTQEGIDNYKGFLDEAADLVLRHGGSLSGEHGDGQQRAALLEKMYGRELVSAFTQFKRIWDPDDRMNPGKAVSLHRVFDVDENLRLGTDYRPADPQTHFQFPQDDGSLDRAVLRCVGVGKCRREGGGIMCPSYMVTREEEHSTRGRARVLFEMLQGEVIDDGWRSREVKDALDLCLSCKGCKNECPVNVDMATYKAEFLSHYYERRLRPRHAYAMGLIMYAAPIGAKIPRLANFALQTPGLSWLAKKLGGLAVEREIPAFAAETFRDWYRGHWQRRATGRRVLLFPDTFTNHFHTHVARAAAEVLDAAGFDVVIPPRRLCCGRPLYDYGMLDLAKRLHRQTLDVLREEIAAGTPMVVPEPSCCASFRDELPELFPHDHDALRLASQTYTLGEFLEKFAPDWELPELGREVLIQSHCHHKSIMSLDAEQKVLERLGCSAEMPATGCCGLAGSWGFEQDKYELSMDCGERVLFPAVRDAAPSTIILADGFSCRSQIQQGTGRRGLHLAQLLQGALHCEGKSLPAARPEDEFEEVPVADPEPVRRGALVGGGLLAVGGAAALVAHWLRRNGE
jgi:FAD/FMN-containing dehydrogenase/Fe-S oxidoreductase